MIQFLYLYKFSSRFTSEQDFSISYTFYLLLPAFTPLHLYSGTRTDNNVKFLIKIQQEEQKENKNIKRSKKGKEVQKKDKKVWQNNEKRKIVKFIEKTV